ncbi:Hypothetical predicted protein [Olea europaea subsp. europaea]|uniref:Uncharacterized protein n=1 Tax=Olea europaea subsp. europaea TaxID=158383 RepID=A0A8S0QCJ5_OLEEU|nr:Hypothetical predicted protein [Olea europaea subsp. europaea]
MRNAPRDTYSTGRHRHGDNLESGRIGSCPAMSPASSILTIVILGVGLNAKFDLTIETWAH